MKRLLLSSSALTLLCLSFSTTAEPFIKTDDVWLRSDIETLANIGVIKSPVTTYPLTWGPILKDLSQVKLNEVSEEYHATYFRVLQRGRNETGRDSTYSEVRASASQEPQFLRYFGDNARSDREFSTRTTGMTNNFAWNLEVTLAPDSIDGDDKRFDGSYVAGIGGNWIFSVGQIEKWWGPGFQHSIILSNNAKPVPAVMLQRNYSEPFETPLLSWMGPWTLTSFLGQLDDSRTINNANLLGLTLSFKPIDSLEIGLRRTAQWGGDGRPENFDSFLDLLIGLDNCDEGNLSCSDPTSEPGNQLAGIDVTWRPNFVVPSALYFQTVGEDEAGYMPSKKSWMYGANFQLLYDDNPIFINFEILDSSVDGDGNDPNIPFDGYNVLYEHSIYNTGYRYLGRSIGSTIDNDSKSNSVNISYITKSLGKFNVSFSSLSLNVDGRGSTAQTGHSLTINKLDINELRFEWLYPTHTFGEFKFVVNSRDDSFDSKLGQYESRSFGVEWKLKL